MGLREAAKALDDYAGPYADRSVWQGEGTISVPIALFVDLRTALNAPEPPPIWHAVPARNMKDNARIQVAHPITWNVLDIEPLDADDCDSLPLRGNV